MAMTELFFFLFKFAVLVEAQRGFISIDCGIPEGSNYTHDETGIFYTSDAEFIHSGENRELPSSNPIAASLKQQYRTMRSFPEGARNCYTIRPVQKGSRYFLRASFMYVDYEKQEVPEFDLYVGINQWTMVSLTNASLPWWTEIVVVATRDIIPVCLMNTGKGDPFISALEARLVEDYMYTEASYNQSLLAMWIYDAGSTSEKIIRYPDDTYDRLWLPYTDPSWESISTSLTVDNKYLAYETPSAVMQTAATPLNSNDSLYFNWTANDPTKSFHVFRHFSNFEKSNGSATLREINCCANGRSCYALTPEYLVTSTVYTTTPLTGDRNYFVSFSKTEKSVLPPILNAFEIYLVLRLNETATDEQDVRAITSIKDIYRLQKNWMGDPCLPNTYLWDGLTCSYNSDDDRPPRIISLRLSSSGLTGNIDASFGNLDLIQTLDLSKNNLTGPVPLFFAKLTSLDHLDLSDNSLTGTVPQVLGTLIYLSYLNLSHNQLSGSVPTSLVDKSRTGSLTLSVDPNLCNSASCNATDPCGLKPCKKSRSSIVIPVVVAVVVAAVLAIGVTGLIWFKRRQARGVRPNSQNINSEAGSVCCETRRFSFEEITTMTNNFQRVLGAGAFGTVYYGQMMDGNEVAVKMLSQHVQASVEFQTEAQLLMTLYHRHLVRFVGYCADKDHRALILEYMPKGNLGKLLAEKDERETLSWDQRLRIALDVALGLEYLHVGCMAPIVHRDVKAANILLNVNLQAKLADFGICKVFTDEHHTHISTQVRGTHGYLDPEYYSDNNLTEKSDVYSFGVVLLELITGKPAIVTQTQDSLKISLCQWVATFLEAGDIRSIVDPKLQSDYDVSSAWRVLDLAISCTQPKSVRRPSMSVVVAQLKECLEVETWTGGNSGAVELSTRSFSTSLYSPTPR